MAYRSTADRSSSRLFYGPRRPVTADRARRPGPPRRDQSGTGWASTRSKLSETARASVSANHIVSGETQACAVWLVSRSGPTPGCLMASGGIARLPRAATLSSHRVAKNERSGSPASRRQRSPSRPIARRSSRDPLLERWLDHGPTKRRRCRDAKRSQPLRHAEVRMDAVTTERRPDQSGLSLRVLGRPVPGSSPRAGSAGLPFPGRRTAGGRSWRSSACLDPGWV
jgi:hypothetical protein